ncbi:tRNA preQ1(34) S-adenosylmethionine ribosyltransferase-isomerase QueA [Cyanobacterium stanieri LEGE 03274]|uniref:S-adenosylmethionine:tRNA ribosyltransferase-isomerase n=1 Tax=Cyanobacterium stanieri LEGE 03274 TaxID=1828756 RepID=A0ABR9V410_9CHRO|nr:tRNA preQ1(34) S-adenosylmethionine ribosyltransferase-isomerase QueA [Cyanobacterium stanieri]MBE9222271.1 tRNA preQ1(34) S-adenosylmethionine ribosyltransferase-isomerase QueA [Cyanobacterium stanieri LEGE 03274]
MDLNLKLSSYDYFLPEELIAQNPVTPRDSSRLLVVKPEEGINHKIFANLPDLLSPGDLLVLNNTKVIPARLYGKKSTGAMVEVLLVEEKSPLCWLALVKPGKRFGLGAQIVFEDEITGDYLTATVIDKDETTGGRILQFSAPKGLSFWDLLERLGNIPFPPYVTESEALPSQYQTIYAERQGAIAAPTAGLHFTEDVFNRLAQKQVAIAHITLHVGIGTFRPVEVEDILNHEMHQEWIEVDEATIDKIKETKSRGGRVISVGTTVVRALEGTFAHHNDLMPYRGKTDLFIYPGYDFKVIDGLITNFHLPKSSLLMLVGALIGRERLLSIYQRAIEEKYRFYSFGDAMFIEPKRGLNN